MNARFGVCAAALVALATPAAAEGWDVILTPYFMAPNMDGKASIGPIAANVSASPADVFRNLNWGAMMLGEVNNGRFGLAFDVAYMSLGTVPDRLVDSIGGHQGAYSMIALARIAPHAEIYAGARLHDLGVTVQATGPLGNERSAHTSQQWVDPLVGMRVNLPLSHTSTFAFVGEFGGFGVGSDIAFQAWPTVDFRLSNIASAQIGYRLAYMKYETGAGLRSFTYDTLTFGPTIGVRLTFE